MTSDNDMVTKITNSVNEQIEKDLEYIKQRVKENAFIDCSKLKALSGVHVAFLIKKCKEDLK